MFHHDLFLFLKWEWDREERMQDIWPHLALHSSKKWHCFQRTRRSMQLSCPLTTLTSILPVFCISLLAKGWIQLSVSFCKRTSEAAKFSITPIEICNNSIELQAKPSASQTGFPWPGGFNWIYLLTTYLWLDLSIFRHRYWHIFISVFVYIVWRE